MIALLTISLLGFRVGGVSFLQQGPSDYAKLFPHPSGQNAIEDYVRAGDLLKASAYGTFQMWIPPENRPTPAQMREDQEADRKARENLTAAELKLLPDASEPKRSVEEQQLIDHVNSLNFYQLKKEVAQQFSGVLDVVANGNRKAASFEFQSGQETGMDFVWLSRVKQLAKLSIDASYYDFATGQPDLATNVLDETLIMGHQVAGGNAVSNLVGIAVTSIALSGFNGHLDGLSVADAKQIATLTSQLLEDKAFLSQMVQNEQRQGLRNLNTWVGSLSEKIPAGTDSSVGKEFQKLTRDQRSDWTRELIQMVERNYDSSSHVFDGPEESWLGAADAVNPPTHHAASSGDDDNEPKTLAQSTAVARESSFIIANHAYLLALLKSRTQLRLMHLHARIIQYRWETGALPQSLEEMKLPMDETYDPLSRRPLQYAVSDTSYRLYSLGNRDTGKIELKYRQSPGQSGGVFDHP